MSKEYNLISDFDYRIIAAFFAGLDRQGPGDDAQTRRALSFIDGLPPRPRIADIGCGTGRQTAVLASALDGPVTAVDLLGRTVTESIPVSIIDVVAPPTIVFTPENWSYDETVGGAAHRRGVVRPAVGRRFHLQHRLREGADPVAEVPQTRRVHRRHGVFVAIVRTARRNGILPRQLP